MDVWNGKWHTNFGDLNLEQNGHDVTGTYANRGYIEAVSRQYGNTYILEGKFTNREKNGFFKFTSTSDENFSGDWKWSTSNNWDGEWGGEKISTIPYFHWQGQWNTSFGELNLDQQGNSVTGTYAGLGIIDATASQDGDIHILEGRFTNNLKEGVFKFTSNTDEHFSGEWQWSYSNNSDGSWEGTRVNTRHESKWQGKWKTTFGDVNFEQSGFSVTGIYSNRGYINAISWNKGQKKYILEGRFNNKSKKGIFKFTSSGNGKYEGKWKWSTSNDWDGDWDGKQVSTLPTLAWQGLWNTQYGTLNLNQNGNKVTGIYADKGIFDAVASQDGNTHILEGRFTNHDSEGLFKFTSNNTGEFSGTWENRIEGVSSGTWNGTKI